MADFTIDVSRSKTSRINLGIQGENIIEHIIFNISSWIEEFGEGDAYVYAQRKGDENPYPVALDMDLDAGTATWTLNATDTAVKGRGKAQLVYVVDEDGTEAITDDEIKKTRVFATTVQTSLVPASEENPDAYETWLEVLGGYTARIEAAEDELEDYVQANTIADVTLNSTSIVEDRVAEIPLASSSAHGAMSSTDKTKLDGIEAGAEVNVQADWNQTDTTKDDYIKNKPADATTSVGGLMSATDKAKLDGIASGAEVNPDNATTSTAGLMSSTDKTKLDKVIMSGDKISSACLPSSYGPTQMNVIEAYDADGGTELQEDWFSEELGGEPLTPEANTIYIHMTDEYDQNLHTMYMWTGTEYAPVYGWEFRWYDVFLPNVDLEINPLAIASKSTGAITLYHNFDDSSIIRNINGITGWIIKMNDGTDHLTDAPAIITKCVYNKFNMTFTLTLFNPLDTPMSIRMVSLGVNMDLTENPA